MFGGLIDIKEELTELDDAVTIHSLEFEHDTTADLAFQASRPILKELNIDLQLLNQPARPNTVNAATATKRKLESMLPIDRVGAAAPTTTLTTTTLSSETSFIASVEASPIEASPVNSEAMPSVAKRAWLGSLSELSDSDA